MGNPELAPWLHDAMKDTVLVPLCALPFVIPCLYHVSIWLLQPQAHIHVPDKKELSRRLNPFSPWEALTFCLGKNTLPKTPTYLLLTRTGLRGAYLTAKEAGGLSFLLVQSPKQTQVREKGFGNRLAQSPVCHFPALTSGIPY